MRSKVHFLGEGKYLRNVFRINDNFDRAFFHRERNVSKKINFFLNISEIVDITKNYQKNENIPRKILRNEIYSKIFKKY